MSTPEPSRERIEQLIAAADRVAHQPLPPPRSRTLPVVLLGVGAVAAVIIGVALASGGDDHTASVTPGQTTAVPTAVTTAMPSTTELMVITLPPTSPPSTVAPSSSEPGTSESATTIAVDPNAPVRAITYEGGKFVLSGTVPDQATADALFSRAAAAVGAENVVLQYTVVPGSSLPESEVMLFPDTFRFAPNSASLTLADLQVLNSMMVLLVQNPLVTLDIRGFTDSIGPDDSNLALSQARVDAIAQYFVNNGIAPERVQAIGMGKADPVASNDTEEGRAMNRRVEFTLHHLLG